MKTYCESCDLICKRLKHQSLSCPKCRGSLQKIQKSDVRRIILKRIGFDSYQDYLASELWAATRAMVLARDESKCCRCGGNATQVHHRDYTEEALRGLSLKHLSSVCAGCHHFAEFNPVGGKTRVSTANRKLDGTHDPNAWKRSRSIKGKRHARRCRNA